MVKVLEHIPCCLLNLVAWEDHVDTLVDCVLHFDGQHTCVAVEILCFTLESVKAVSVLEVECCDTSHSAIGFWEQESAVGSAGVAESVEGLPAVVSEMV